MLFRQEIGRKRGGGGFSNIRGAEGEERRAFPLVLPPEEPRRPLGSELASERGRSLPRRSLEDKLGAGLEDMDFHLT